MTRKLANDPEEWLWMHTQSRTSCPARCDGGKVYYQTERSSWEYPGAWEGRPCERCCGLGYLPRVWLASAPPTGNRNQPNPRAAEPVQEHP